MTTGSVNPTCGDCRFWIKKVSGLGDCVRFPPTPMPGGQAVPQMAASDWCGEHEERGTPAPARPAGFVPPSQVAVKLAPNAKTAAPPKKRR